jgi:hypothetical protein
MSISKLLMTAAVCTMSVTAVSTSYGSDTVRVSTDEEMSPSVQRFVEHDGTGNTVDLEATRSSRRRGSGSVSQMSCMSMSTVSDETLQAWIVEIRVLLRQVPREVTLPQSSKAISDRGHLNIIRTALQNLVVAYNQKNSQVGQIVAKMKSQGQALTEAETKVDQAEESAARWRNRTIMMSAVFTVVTGVLLNVVRKHGWTVLFGK